MKDVEKTCCICGKAYEGHGHNPWPVKEDGRCCREYNYMVVLPERLKRHYANK